MEIKIFTDGGSRGNPGPAAIGVWAEDNQGNNLFKASIFIGQATNNTAEYLAFIKSVELFESHFSTLQPQKVTWFLDSQLVVEQLNKSWKIKQDHIRDLAEKAWQLLNQITIPYTISHIPREKNQMADKMVNLALDHQSK